MLRPLYFTSANLVLWCASALRWVLPVDVQAVEVVPGQEVHHALHKRRSVLGRGRHLGQNE